MNEFENRENQIVNDAALRRPASSQPNVVGKQPHLIPQKQAKVLSTFDTRPVNAQDFFKSGGDIVFSTSALLDDTETGTYSYLIPKGVVAVLRGFSWGFDPVYGFNTTPSMITTLSIDGQSVPFLDSIEDLQTVNEMLPTHFIIDENKTLKITSKRVSNVALATRGLVQSLVNFDASFYGNMLQKSNLPSNFEIASL